MVSSPFSPELWMPRASPSTPHPFASPARRTIMSHSHSATWDHNPGGTVSKTATSTTLAERLAAVDWRGIASALDAHGCAVAEALVAPEACAALAASYEVEDAFRSRIVMASHGFGSGEYKYFAYPLPPVVSELRAAMYPPLAA